jgi:hypothetical protein
MGLALASSLFANVATANVDREVCREVDTTARIPCRSTGSAFDEMSYHRGVEAHAFHPVAPMTRAAKGRTASPQVTEPEVPPSSLDLAKEEQTSSPRSSNRKAQTKDRSGWIVLPVAGYSPEKSVELGGLALRFFDVDRNSSLSSLPLLLTATFRKQFLAELRPEFFFDDDNYRIWTRFDGQRYPDFFYGVGNEIDPDEREHYEKALFRVRTNLRRRIASDLHGGIQSDHLVMALEYLQNDSVFARGNYTGEQGGLVAGFGPTLAYDTRDHKNYPTRGLLLEALATPHLKWFGSDYSYWRLLLDARAYIPTLSKQLLAFQLLYESTLGQVPFYMLPQLGGGDIVRGYFAGKYRDKQMQALQAEYRAHLFWRFGAVAFANIGQVGESYAQMWNAPARPSFGDGLRINMKDPDDIVNFRVDFGTWPWSGDMGLYVAVLEAF